MRTRLLVLSLLGVLGLCLFLHRPADATLPPVMVNGSPLPTLAPILERVTPAVVNINTQQRVANPFGNDPFFRQFFNVPQERINQSLGSGVIVDAERGYVLTNNHVVQGADEIAVTLTDGRTLKGRFVGSDPDSDVAVVQIPSERLTAIRLADSDAIRVGDFVVAVGNPFGLGQTVTSGIVSALGRSSLEGLNVQNFIQTDASINPGNSGGALINLAGELIGVNTAIYSPSGGNVGIGFAIPANLAKSVMNQLISTGQVSRGTLGVDTQPLDARLAKALNTGDRVGAVVTRVREGSAAADAGLKPGDVVLKLAGRAVRTPADLRSAEGQQEPGADVAITVLRGGRELNLSAALKARGNGELASADIDPRLSGATLTDVPANLVARGVRGVLVRDLARGSVFAESGLRPGDLINAVNRVPIEDTAQFEEIARRAIALQGELLLKVTRGRSAFFVLIQ
jgi:serine protease DegQ